MTTNRTAALENDRRAALNLADRVVAMAHAKKEREKAARSVSMRADRRRARLALPLTRRDVELDVVERYVDNPLDPTGQDKTRTNFNRRIDLLENEVSHRRLSEVQYTTGRLVEAVLDRQAGRSGGGGFEGGSRADPVTARELRMIYAVTDARTIKSYVERIERALGPIDTRLLRRILGDRMSFSAVAEATGKGSGDRGARYVAERFRDALDTLAEAWAARGAMKLVEEDVTLAETDPETGERLVLTSAPEIRAHREADGPAVETDVNGVQVPPGQGYRLSQDPAARWKPATRRRDGLAVTGRR